MQKLHQNQGQLNSDEIVQKREDLLIELDQLNKNLNDMKADEYLQQQLKENFQKMKKIDKNSVSLLKSLNVPPPILLQVCIQLLVIFSPQSESTWTECRKLLGKQDFFLMILNLDILSITNEQLLRLSSVNEIDENKAAMVSTAAAQFLSFIKAVYEIRKSQIYETQYKIQQIQIHLGRLNNQNG